METEIVKQLPASDRRIAAIEFRNDGRTNRVSHSKTKSYKNGLIIDRSRIWRRAQAAEELSLAEGSEFRCERRALEAKSKPSRLRAEPNMAAVEKMRPGAPGG